MSLDIPPLVLIFMDGSFAKRLCSMNLFLPILLLSTTVVLVPTCIYSMTRCSSEHVLSTEMRLVVTWPQTLLALISV